MVESTRNLRRRIVSLAAGVVLLVPTLLAPSTTLAGRANPEPGGAALPAAELAAPVESAVQATLDFVPAAPNPAVPAGYEQVGETPSLRLYIDKSDSKIIVEDKRNGKLWTSTPLEPLSDQKSLLDDAVFLLNYTNARRQMTNLASSASEKPALAFQNRPNGVRATYSIEKLKIKIDIDYAIKEEPSADGPGTVPYLEVTIPKDGVEESGDCSTATSPTCFMVVTVELLPLFGAAPVGAEGYLMVPDEAGAIVNFKPEYPQYRQRYSAAVYGTDAAQSAFTFGRGMGGGGSGSISRIRMPIWGLKNADTAYAGIITKGEYQANINGYLAGYITNANRGSTEFVFRRQASIPRRRTLFVNRIEDNLIPGERQVRYVILDQSNASYAGMAKAYRDYLMKSKGLKKLPKENPRPLLDLYMGITRRAGFREDFVPMTTFNEAIKIVQGLLDKGVKDFDVQLIGWNDAGDRGMWPRRYPAEQTLGGNEGLRRFTSFAHKNGLRVYLYDNYVYGYLESSGGIIGQIPLIRNIWPNWSYGFNTRFDTIRGVNKLPVFSGGRTVSRSGTNLYLINPHISRTDYVARDLPTHKAMGADGFTLHLMGSLVMSDTNERFPLSRDDVAAEWMKMADMSRETLGHAMVAGANAYVIGHTDRIYDAPVDSIDAFGDTPVPVYHIATNGLVTRQTMRANLRNDPKTEFLRQIEWGMQPTYQLTHQPSSDLIRTSNNQLYSSQWTDWLEPAAKEYTQMRDEFGYLNSQFITNHEILANRVHRVTYEDGSQLLVNYNPMPYSGPEGSVGAYGYVLRKGSGR
ncbi:MAG: hypothetical protein HY332_03130 [Chloroflexi bacterium]|nr:hypothetical protein [Chloroflexota bacterium]